MFHSILVPVDGSATSRKGLDQAIQLAKEQKAKIRLVHVVSAGFDLAPYMEGRLTANLIEELRREGEQTLQQALAQARAAGLEADSILLDAPRMQTGELIVQQASDWAADLIVMGTHGRRGLRRLVLGSDAEFVIRHTTVPVLLVRMQA